MLPRETKYYSSDTYSLSISKYIWVNEKKLIIKDSIKEYQLFEADKAQNNAWDTKCMTINYSMLRILWCLRTHNNDVVS